MNDEMEDEDECQCSEDKWYKSDFAEGLALAVIIFAVLAGLALLYSVKQ
jgi:hypothetical protein